TAPGLVVPSADGRSGVPTVVVLPGPPRELQEMWPAAVQAAPFREAVAGAVELREGMLRLYGIPESSIARTLEEIEASGVPLERLDGTTRLRRGEVQESAGEQTDAD